MDSSQEVLSDLVSMVYKISMLIMWLLNPNNAKIQDIFHQLNKKIMMDNLQTL